jgi:hypothetical protein
MQEYWKKLGEQLGLKYDDSFSAILESPVLSQLSGQAMNPENIEKIKEMLEQPMFKKFYEEMFPCLVSGKFGKYPVFIYPVRFSSQSSTAHNYQTNLNMSFNTRYEFDMQMKKSTFFSRLFSGGSIKSHDPDFNRLITVKAKRNKAQVKTFLENSALTHSMKELITVSPAAVLSDIGVKCMIPSGEPDVRSIKDLLDTMRKVLDCFY